MVTFYGPMLAQEPDGEIDISSIDNLLPILFSEKCSYKFEFLKENVINSGTASGILVGGCLSLFCSLLGSSYLPDLNGTLLFLEDTNEKPYRIDRMLTQIKINGILNKVNGVLFGNFSHCEPSSEDSTTVDNVINEICSDLEIPVVKNISFGHIKDKITIPMGIEGTLNTEQRFFSFDEPAVI
ncbi:LD-carboxypeptidase [candidate division KSB1 bacterium]